MFIGAASLTEDIKDWINSQFDEFHADSGFEREIEEFCYEYTEGDERIAIGRGRYFAGWCNLSELIVSAKSRGKGIGAQMMKHIEEESKKRNQKGIILTTISFQAPEFYEKLGFVKYATLQPYAGPNQRLYYKKEF